MAIMHQQSIAVFCFQCFKTKHALSPIEIVKPIELHEGHRPGRTLVLLDRAQGLPADLTLTARDVSYTDGRIATADLDADLTLKGPLMRDPVLGGRADVKTVEVTIPKANGGAGPTASSKNPLAPPNHSMFRHGPVVQETPAN